MTKLTDTLFALVELLERLSIQYAVMGGIAVRAYGVPRPTYDLDVTVVLDCDKLPRLFDELREMDYSVPDVYDSGWVDTIRDLPLLKLRRYMGGESLDVDLFLAESEFQEELMTRRRRADAEGRPVWLVSPEDLVLLKLIAARPRDLGDISDVLFMQGRLDESYMRRWAGELGVVEDLERILTQQAHD